MRQKNVNKPRQKIILILHNIRSAQNVGAIFRTADAAGVSKIYLTGYTPGPKDKFGRLQKEIHKTALGAEEYVPWERVPRISILLAKLKKEGVCIYAVEQTKNALPYTQARLKTKTAFIFGNEVDGLSLEIIKRCDNSIFIPMKGCKESLNVSVATGVVLFQALAS